MPKSPMITMALAILMAGVMQTETTPTGAVDGTAGLVIMPILLFIPSNSVRPATPSLISSMTIGRITIRKSQTQLEEVA